MKKRSHLEQNYLGFTDLLVGIVLGLIVGIFQVLYNNFKKPYEVRTFKDNGEDVLHLELSENLTFLSKASMIDTVAHIPDNSSILIDASMNPLMPMII